MCVMTLQNVRLNTFVVHCILHSDIHSVFQVMVTDENL